MLRSSTALIIITISCGLSLPIAVSQPLNDDDLDFLKSEANDASERALESEVNVNTEFRKFKLDLYKVRIGLENLEISMSSMRCFGSFSEYQSSVEDLNYSISNLNFEIDQLKRTCVSISSANIDYCNEVNEYISYASSQRSSLQQLLQNCGQAQRNAQSQSASQIMEGHEGEK